MTHRHVADNDDGAKHSYLSQNMASWADSLPDGALPTFRDLFRARYSTAAVDVIYERDGLQWRSDFFTKVVHADKGTERKLVIRLPNDGCFEPLLESDKLEPFETFARRWFGYPGEKKLQRQVRHHDKANRLDICIRCPETRVFIEFSFEPGVPVTYVPEEFWF